jgi:YVTN family beta-propeller protein
MSKANSLFSRAYLTSLATPTEARLRSFSPGKLLIWRAISGIFARKRAPILVFGESLWGISIAAQRDATKSARICLSVELCPSVKSIALANLALSTLLWLALSPFANAQAPRLIVLNKQANTAAIIDPASLKVVATVPTGEGPHEAVVTSDGKLAIVANYGAQTPGNSLSIIDIDTARELRRIDLGALRRPHGMQLVSDASGDKVYFTSETSRTVARFDVKTEKVDWIMGTGGTSTHMVAVSPNGKQLYTTNIGSNDVTFIRLDAPPSRANIVQISVGAQPEAIDISPDGREIWVGQNADGGVSVIDAETNKVKDTFKVGALPIRLKFSPDGKYVLLSDPRGGNTSSSDANNLTAIQALGPNSGEVIVVETATRKVVKRIPVRGVPLGIQFAPDGKRAYVSRTLVRQVDVIDMQTLTVLGSVETGDGPDGLAWRASGAK